MLLYIKHTEIKNKKSLSMLSRISENLKCHNPNKSKNGTKALQYVRLTGSFTVEAAFVVPLFLFAAVVFLGLFRLLSVEVQVTGGLQYASRMLAVSCCEQDEPIEETVLLLKGRILFQKYLGEHGCKMEGIQNGTAGISFWGSRVSDTYVELRASYQVALPVTFWKMKRLPVRQCVRSRRWIGACSAGTAGDEAVYVYITETGSAYHQSASCAYLDLSIRNVTLQQAQLLRNKNGNIYYPCSCVKKGQTSVYITDYGTQYHGDLSCSGLKRTVYKIKKEEAGARHPCSKCWKGDS